jgi:uncharacterized protein (TIGR02145 family)
MVFSAFGQNPSITLTFTALEDSSYSELDSIHITNISKGADTTLYFPDTVLTLDYWTGIGTNESTNKELTVFQNVPNPLGDETTIKIFVPNDEKIEIIVSDLLSKVIFKDEYKLNQGFHLFTFQPGKSNSYLFTATNGISRSSIKIIANRSNGIPGIQYIGNTGGVIQKRRQLTGDAFQFTTGDTLIYEGFSMTTSNITGSDVLLDAPEASSEYTFQIINGIPCPDAPLIIHSVGSYTDIYATVQVGSQCWMKENFKLVVGGWCYENDPEYCEVYGRLYSWDWIMNNAQSSNSIPSGVQGRCPDGWHLPSLGEWEILIDYLGGEEVAGGKLKETGTAHWENPNVGATNESGFTALPAGLRFDGGYPFGWLYSNLETTGYFWTTTIGENLGLPTIILLWDYHSSAVTAWSESNSCISVRCVKDQ